MKPEIGIGTILSVGRVVAIQRDGVKIETSDRTIQITLKEAENLVKQ